MANQEVFLVEHRQSSDYTGVWIDESFVMFVASTLEKAINYCLANQSEELEDTENKASWFVVCKHTVDLDDPTDGVIVYMHGVCGELHEQPYAGYGELNHG